MISSKLSRTTGRDSDWSETWYHKGVRTNMPLRTGSRHPLTISSKLRIFRWLFAAPAYRKGKPYAYTSFPHSAVAQHLCNRFSLHGQSRYPCGSWIQLRSMPCTAASLGISHILYALSARPDIFKAFRLDNWDECAGISFLEWRSRSRWGICNYSRG